MRFCIATIEFWNSLGYNTEHWRKSVDGTKALVHLEYAEVLVPDLVDRPEVAIYERSEVAFKNLLASPEWTAPMPEGETE